ncbi:MAG: helix-turn-helix domain-containing protein [Flavobacterium sp.]|uniref:helix-turn-helix domain-containing protein n=1 Tax=Flavobacterium sp. NRK F7 TaxID=2954930 RepID=UPI0020918176|nr:helix-turn-helix transcriptional regulator [Flavobacterium sp. NRK F7]MCO6163956.1 helix-turn-helix domain-containing protein [Flavobacterium sp. NRK F7]MDK2772189.1 helix-turn-helix domain-containing protein [Flavobacterium sp.]
MEKKQKNEVILLGKKIKTLIVEKNLTVMNVAHDANLDATNLRKYIRGSQEMKVTTLIRIAGALNVSTSELLDDLIPKKKN